MADEASGRDQRAGALGRFSHQPRGRLPERWGCPDEGLQLANTADTARAERSDSVVHRPMLGRCTERAASGGWRCKRCNAVATASGTAAPSSSPTPRAGTILRRGRRGCPMRGTRCPSRGRRLVRVSARPTDASWRRPSAPLDRSRNSDQVSVAPSEKTALLRLFRYAQHDRSRGVGGSGPGGFKLTLTMHASEAGAFQCFPAIGVELRRDSGSLRPTDRATPEALHASSDV